MASQFEWRGERVLAKARGAAVAGIADGGQNGAGEAAANSRVDTGEYRDGWTPTEPQVITDTTVRGGFHNTSDHAIYADRGTSRMDGDFAGERAMDTTFPSVPAHIKAHWGNA